MKKLLLSGAAIGALFAGSAAHAADLPAYKAPPPVAYYNWSGFYVGGIVGPGWGVTDVNGLLPRFATLPPFVSGQTDLRGAGVLGGVAVGINYQVGYWVFGAEADYAGTNFNGNRTCPGNAVIMSQFTCHTDIDAIATVAGRLGYAWNNVLLFAKGGGAWKRGSESITFNAVDPTGPNPGLQANVVSDNRSGWVVGGGMEFGFTPNWSAKVEYDYLDFGSRRVTGTDFQAVPLALDWDVKQRVHAVKFGVNYRFGSGPVYANY